MAKKKNVTVEVDLSDYANQHSNPECSGKFEFSYTINAPYSGSALGVLRLSAVPMFVCHECQSGFIAPKFREWFEERVCEKLISAPGLLSKKQVKFLRQFLGLTQEELARKLGVADRHEFSKMESPKSQRILPEDKHFRLKLLAARFLGIKDAEKIFELNEAQSEKEVRLDSTAFFSEAEVRKAFG